MQLTETHVQMFVPAFQVIFSCVIFFFKCTYIQLKFDSKCMYELYFF